jgi:hypothetical protein
VGSKRQLSWIWRGTLSLLVLAVLAFTLNALVFSGASFTAGSADAANVFTAGTLSNSNDQSGQVMLDASGLAPGRSSVGTMNVTNAGTVAGAFTLNPTGLANTPASPALSDTLVLKVEDVTGTATTLYQGSATAFATTALGTIAPGATRSYRLTLSYPAGTDVAALQGATMTMALQVTGVSL